MKRLLRVLLMLLVCVAVGVGALCYVYRQTLLRQWACYRVGNAESFDEARNEIASCEQGADRRQRLAELVRAWGTGNPTFDLYVARHVDHPDSSDLMRELFSKELGRRPELLARWARYWSYRAKLQPDQEINAMVEHLDTQISAGMSKPLTWREVLDLQAAFKLLGCREPAVGLTPDNWHVRYRNWQHVRGATPPHVERPNEPFSSSRIEKIVATGGSPVV